MISWSTILFKALVLKEEGGSFAPIPAGGHLAMSGGCHNLGRECSWHLVGGEQGCWSIFSILQCTGLPTAEGRIQTQMLPLLRLSGPAFA